MKTNYLILFLVLPTLIFGQETIQITRKRPLEGRFFFERMITIILQELLIKTI